MAISKTQNERPAILALIDAANALEIASNTHAQNIATLTEGLGDEISNRESTDAQLQSAIALEVSNRTAAIANVQNQIGEGFSSELTVAQSLSATNRAIETIDDEIGDGLFSSSFTITQGYQRAENALVAISEDVATLQNWQNRFRLGLTPNVTVEMGDSTSDTLAFATPFEDDAEVAVFLICVDGSEILTDLSCKLISATYSGFSFAVFNDSQTDVTIKVGFLAVRMN